jgi:hypothetical protein
MAKATIEEGNITVQVPTKTIERAKQQFLKVFDIKNLRGLTLFFGLGTINF